MVPFFLAGRCHSSLWMLCRAGRAGTYWRHFQRFRVGRGMPGISRNWLRWAFSWTVLKFLFGRLDAVYACRHCLPHSTPHRLLAYCPTLLLRHPVCANAWYLLYAFYTVSPPVALCHHTATTLMVHRASVCTLSVAVLDTFSRNGASRV